MFTGIVSGVGTLLEVQKRGSGAQIKVQTPDGFMQSENVKLGDSIACNGVCLTVTSLNGTIFTADVSFETMEHTCFAEYSRGTKLNLEAAVTPATHMGGHIVQGHVDGVGTITSITKSSEAYDVTVQCTADLLRYIAYKGSITVDGISLTVNDVSDEGFRLTLIPHTGAVTTFDNWRSGKKVNLEADVLARYLERLMESKSSFADKKSEGLSLQTLIENGF
ncbi:MAG: riboflavin synthase [Succinatimonas sp.]|nr:riboflavin synthase [Succinatimonas sp.]